MWTDSDCDWNHDDARRWIRNFFFFSSIIIRSRVVGGRKVRVSFLVPPDEVLRRRCWIRSTSQQRVRVIDCLQARTPPDAFRLEVPAPLQHPNQNDRPSNVRPRPLPSPLHLPLPIHSPIPVISPERSHDFFIPCLFLKCSPSIPPPTRQFIILSIYVPVIPLHSR